MKRLAPDQIDRRFQELMAMGRARLPELAPEWTDHNAHDPGITLMELLAWVTEAQLYSLARTRRDQRAAFATLLGLSPAGTQPARGVLWPDWSDTRSPAATFAASLVIPADAVVNRLDAESPTFRPDSTLLWVSGRIRHLAARLAEGREIDYTKMNERGGAAFLPFGALAGPRDVLVMEFECRGDGGLFPEKRSDADGALWSIGVRADKALGDAAQSDTLFMAASSAPLASPIAATLVTSTQRTPLKVVSDSSAGLLRTGVLLLDMSAVEGSPKSFAIELRAPRGFERPPRVLRIEPNVLPVVQGKTMLSERNTCTGLPDSSLQLQEPGLRFASFEPPLKLEVKRAGTYYAREWRLAKLSDSDPDDEVYELDVATRTITFGNGVNGRIPPAGAEALVTYSVCDGERGNVAANRKWHVTGFIGSFGVNVDAVSGGRPATGWVDERREARRRILDDHALVSAVDIEAAARALPLLEVARTWVLTPTDTTPRTGTVTLVAMRARSSEAQSGSVPETRRWLEAIRRRLAPRLPLATRLAVVGPSYIDFSVRAAIDAAPGRDPTTIRTAVEGELVRRLALVGLDARHPGVPVTSRDVTAWIRAVEGVRRVATVRLVNSLGQEGGEIAVPRSGLPRLDASKLDLDVRRAGSGGAP